MFKNIIKKDIKELKKINYGKMYYALTKTIKLLKKENRLKY